MDLLQVLQTPEYIQVRRDRAHKVYIDLLLFKCEDYMMFSYKLIGRNRQGKTIKNSRGRRVDFYWVPQGKILKSKLFSLVCFLSSLNFVRFDLFWFFVM